MMRSILAVLLSALLLGACLPESKTGCRTTDDCASRRMCVAGTCQTTAAFGGLDASSERQFQQDLGGATAVDQPQNPAYLDAGGPDQPIAEDVTADQFARPNTDQAAYPGDVTDSAADAMDQAGDVPMVVAFDAYSGLEGLDTSTDRHSPVDMPIDPSESSDSYLPSSPDIASDLDSSPADAASDVRIAPMIDSSFFDSRPWAADTSDAPPSGTGDLAPGLVSWENFRARCPREPWAGGRYIVDGDLALDEAGLQSYYDAWFAAESVSPENLAPMGATNWWRFPDSTSLSYCISTDFGDNLAVVEAAMGVATASWSDRAGVRYAYAPEEDASCDANNSNVTFDVRPVSGAGYAAVSFFPDSPRSVRSVLVDASEFAADSGAVDLEAVLRHQLGHTLGFQHERVWLDPACASEDSRLAVKIADYDVDSVMHLPACRPSESGGIVQTEGDLVGAVTIYGLAPALTILITM